MKTFYVYIMSSATGTLYTGITSNIVRRVSQHKKAEMPGFSKKYKTNRLVYFEETLDVGQAILREKEIKGWRRSKKIALIKTSNPTCEDLAIDWFDEKHD